jgi:hypothetical protein
MARCLEGDKSMIFSPLKATIEVSRELPSLGVYLSERVERPRPRRGMVDDRQRIVTGGVDAGGSQLEVGCLPWSMDSPIGQLPQLRNPATDIVPARIELLALPYGTKVRPRARCGPAHARARYHTLEKTA